MGLELNFGAGVILSQSSDNPDSLQMLKGSNCPTNLSSLEIDPSRFIGKVSLGIEGVYSEAHGFGLSGTNYVLLVFGFSDSDYNKLLSPAISFSPKTQRKAQGKSVDTNADILVEKNLILREEYESERKKVISLEISMQAKERKEEMLLEEIENLSKRNLMLLAEVDSLSRSLEISNLQKSKDACVFNEKISTLEEELRRAKNKLEVDLAFAMSDLKKKDATIKEREKKISSCNEELSEYKKQVESMKDIKNKRDDQFYLLLDRLELSQSAQQKLSMDNEILRQGVSESRDMVQRLVQELERYTDQRRLDLRDANSGVSRGYYSEKARNDSMMREQECTSRTREIAEYVKLREMITDKNIKQEKRNNQDISQLSTGAFSTSQIPLLDQMDKFHDASLFGLQQSPINTPSPTSIVLDKTTEMYLKQLVKFVQSNSSSTKNIPIVSPFNLKSFLFSILNSIHSAEKENNILRTGN